MGSKLPNKDPLIKLTPRIKLKGRSIVSIINKLTLFFVLLFCIMRIKDNRRNPFIRKDNMIFLN